MLAFIKMVAVLVAAISVGNWFLAELQNARRRRAPWHTAYVSPPGLIILAAVILPVIIWALNRF